MATTTSRPDSGPATMFEKIWRRHVVVDRPDGYTLLYIDRHLIHDGSYNAFRRLGANGLKLRRPDRAFATPDHYMPTNTRDKSTIADPNHKRMVTGLTEHAAATGVTIFDIGDRRQGMRAPVAPLKRKPAFKAGFAISSPKTFPPRVKRPHAVFGSTLPGEPGVSPGSDDRQTKRAVRTVACILD